MSETYIPRNDDDLAVPANRLVDSNQMVPNTTIQQAQDRARNPALAYLMSLRSAQSRVTMKSYLSILAKKLGYDRLEDCPWQDLTRQHVMALVEALQMDGLAPNTINTYLAGVKGVALEARSLRLMDTDNFLDIKAVKRVRGYRLPKGRALERHEIDRLIAACRADSGSKAIRDEAMLKVLLGCGLRRDEVVRIDYPDHVDWRNDSLRIRGKGNKERRAYMPKGTVKALRRWVMEVRGEQPGPLFTRIRRHDTLTLAKLSNQAVYFVLAERCLAAGIEEVAPHDLRRTFATTMMDAGVDILTLQRMMGHASVETTKQYDKRGDDAMRQATDQFAMF
ncbi:tyrosine-type recombinase/integrase [Phytohalomonas tamaricis]|uniref:tyrosine-type recombinase/integrase n=1 Tax=Phytohalomonas tamaricis TaxID=2081032 RepID=UPI0021D40FF0|nr:tyrosine-type recombinase/integrase [Phytohalomonas tamaricis]